MVVLITEIMEDKFQRVHRFVSLGSLVNDTVTRRK
jgi:hypothetical protein